MMLFNGATASKEGNKENDTSNHHQQNGSVEERITQKVQIVAVNPLNDATSDDQWQASDLKLEFIIINT